ncbi:substrate-binding domain-containing protein [Vallitalea sp.]|jgi:ribose transport system substrate-binding protein|uniref:substrate-binding domain-containing protein n=1 Tax=Vallitalea sp. TaxID=1882829 RepID=UPI0025FBC96B|nr:substrate-binding domain-containing protein [Vallitalea sp.]MCT4687357.1 substrate-binding domain-containing protein [Vallitalea sp.]
MKKIMTILLVMVLIFSFVGCSSKTSDTTTNNIETENNNTETKEDKKETKQPGEKYTIGVSLPGPDNQWVAAVIDFAKKEASIDTDKFDVTITTASTPAQQVADIEDLLTKKPDAMVVFPLESAPVTPICDQLYSQGIPLVVLTRGINSESYDVFIHGDDKAVGIQAAHYIGQKLNGSGNVVEMLCAPSEIQVLRTEGFHETLEAYYPDIEIIAQGQGNFAREPALKEMENLLQAHDKIDAVYSQDDEQSLGILAAIQASGREGEMLVTGVGGNKSVLELMMDGDDSISASFSYSPLQGGSAVKIAKMLVTGQGFTELYEPGIPREIILSAEPITLDNAKNYYNKDSKY